MRCDLPSRRPYRSPTQAQRSRAPGPGERALARGGAGAFARFASGREGGSAALAIAPLGRSAAAATGRTTRAEQTRHGRRRESQLDDAATAAPMPLDHEPTTAGVRWGRGAGRARHGSAPTNPSRHRTLAHASWSF